MNDTKITVIITSGGNSTRYGKNKLLEKMGSISVIETTISKFIDIADKIIIPVRDDTKKHILNSTFYSDKIHFVLAGLTRQKSVYNALKLCDSEGIILIHDGARPFVDSATIQKVIDAANKFDAAAAGIIAIDTIKEIKDGIIIKTLKRENIFITHTPQGFRADLIKKIHENFKNDNNFPDDSSMAEAFGINVHCVLGNKNNIKITVKEDLKI